MKSWLGWRRVRKSISLHIFKQLNECFNDLETPQHLPREITAGKHSQELEHAALTSLEFFPTPALHFFPSNSPGILFGFFFTISFTLLLHTPTLNTTASDSQLPLAPHPFQGSPTTRSICQPTFSTTFVNKASPGVLRIPLLSSLPAD